MTSEDGRVNYGPIFISDDCAHILPYMKKGRRIRPFRTLFHKWHKTYSLYHFFRYPLQFFLLFQIINRFKQDYFLFKKECEKLSQKEALKHFPFLWKLHHESAASFANQSHIKGVIDGFLGEVGYLCTFTPLSTLNAFELMHLIMHLFIPIYEFTFLKEKLIHGFEDRIFIDSVFKITRQDDIYRIRTRHGRDYFARHVVCAAPFSAAAKLLNLKVARDPAPMHIFHLKGDLRRPWRDGCLTLFDSRSKIVALLPQADGTFLFYSIIKHPSFEHYFKDYSLIAHQYWNPAFSLSRGHLLDVEQGPNLYMIGDHNIIGMEDSFITGIYAANQILNS